MNEIREFSSKLERLRFVIFRDCFGAEIVDRHARRVEWRGMNVKTPICISLERNYRVFVEI
jgi:hypothetical protein